MAVLLVGVASCGEDGFKGLKLGKDKTETTENAPSDGTIKLVERDVEAPEAFEVNSRALWDGRPSLGGVWVAHPDSKQPERVIIRNPSNDKFVIGALFRRERNNPGPALQLSSDAAAALGVLAGQPTTLRVTALRRETVNETAPPEGGEAQAPQAVETGELPPVAETGTADLKKKVLASVQKSKTTPKKSSLEKPYVQIGFFSVEANATANVAKMNKSGIPAKIVKSTAKGKTFWRVLAGPAASASEQRQLLGMVKKQGFADAYFVTK
ncbi:MAG: SPOR domain-containing protein [Rhodobacteraceae bacterium]|nr:SPOR domain-containing protein [Paracoccaceae bacterium]